MGVIETARLKPARAGSESALHDWVRALEATAPIAANPRRLLSDVIEELAQTQGDAPALLSASENLTYRALAERANRLRPLGARSRPRQGRYRLPDDAEPA